MRADLKMKKKKKQNCKIKICDEHIKFHRMLGTGLNAMNCVIRCSSC